jgi:hypothetical protein
VCDEGHWIPVEFAVFHGAGRRGGDAYEGYEGEDEREEGYVDYLPFYADARVTREVGLGVVRLVLVWRVERGTNVPG